MIRKRSGSIVNISSSAAIEGNEGRTAYAASKAAMITTTKVMAKELASNNIRVNAIAPGLTDTDMMNNNTPKNLQTGPAKRQDIKILKTHMELLKDNDKLKEIYHLISNHIIENE